jgi:hypothetical protein
MAVVDDGGKLMAANLPRGYELWTEAASIGQATSTMLLAGAMVSADAVIM